MTRRRFLAVLASIGCFALAGGPATGADWHVAPDGKEKGTGTEEAPWDIATALGGGHKVEPGDTIWIHGGTYHAPPRVGAMGYEVRLVGRDGATVRVRPAKGERVTIDGGLNVAPPSTFLEIHGLEILVSEPRPSGPIPPDPSYANVNRPWGGLNVYSGTGCKFVNLVIHDNSQGVSWWTESKNSEVYGCIIYDNGWAGTDRGHGHAVYTQNSDGTKTVADCIMTGGYGYTLHAYGSSRAYVDNYLVEGNIAYDAGTFLIGGGRPSHGIRVLGNALHGVSLQLGYSAPSNEDCEVRDNLIVDGGLAINKYKKVLSEGNLVVAQGAPRPEGLRVVMRPNRYDPLRAHLAVFNWGRKPEVDVDAGGFLGPGDRYRLLNPRDVFGKPVLEGTSVGKTIRIPMKGEFAAFVVMKAPKESSGGNP